MGTFSQITLIVNGATLALALAFLLILLWNDYRKELNQFFAAFLFFVALWTGGSLLLQIVTQAALEGSIRRLALGVAELGFTGASVAVYTLTAVLVRAHTKSFRALGVASLGVFLLYRTFFLANAAVPSITSTFSFQQQPIVIGFYLLFDFGTLFLVWQSRRKIRSTGITVGLVLFVVGQTLGFVNSELQIFEASILISSVAALLLSFSIVGREIIKPLAERNSQVEAIRGVSLAITNLAGLDSLLEQIAVQTADLLKTDGGVSLFLLRVGILEVESLEAVTVHQLPKTYLNALIPMGQGVAGTVAHSRESMQIDDYGRDWRGSEDFPLAKETFGSVICAALVYGGKTIGALMVIAARHGRLFQKDDLYLLELLAAQAAVAISHSQLFGDVEAARSQLESVLTSTESPVVAVDRKFRLIFANRAAKLLLNITDGEGGADFIQRYIPGSALPGDFRRILRELKQRGTFTYEVSLKDRVFLCNLGALNKPNERFAGWVAVLNDITQLKELDRLKSEMVRMTSHDLKNPLQAAMANVELLQDELPGIIPAHLVDSELMTSIQEIDWQLQRMNRIIRGILDLERVKNGVMRLETYHPSRIIEESAHELIHFAAHYRIILTIDAPEQLPTIRCDVEQFKRALVNLMENAIKFTPAGGWVKVTAFDQMTEFADREVVFTVTDNGVGIAEDRQPRIFDRFYRVNQQGTEHITGSGVGLSLVKTVMENHRARLWLTSEVGKGTTFYVAVPVNAPVDIRVVSS